MKIRQIAHIIKHPQKAKREYAAKEKRIHYKNGLDPQNTYYVIRCNLPECGFFAIFMYILDHLAICKDKGYIPIIDIEQYDTLYKEDKPVNGNTDPWLYYFLPPSDAKLRERYENVILSPIAFPHYKAIYYYRDKEKNVLPEAERISYLHSIVEKNLRFNETVRSELEGIDYILNGKRTLGIHVRGTDMYTEGKQHPIPTGKTKDFSVIDSILREHRLDNILLCTDTEETVRIFKEYYGEIVITTNALRQKDDSHTGLHKDNNLSGRNNHKYLMGLEVIKDMYLLSKCNVLVCGPSNVAFTAVIYNDNKYEKVYYYV